LAGLELKGARLREDAYLFGQIHQPHTGIGKPRFDAGTFVCQPLYLACQIISARPIGVLVGNMQQYVAAGKRRADFQYFVDNGRASNKRADHC
jgi:hypothetical protein